MEPDRVLNIAVSKVPYHSGLMKAVRIASKKRSRYTRCFLNQSKFFRFHLTNHGVHNSKMRR